MRSILLIFIKERRGDKLYLRGGVLNTDGSLDVL